MVSGLVFRFKSVQVPDKRVLGIWGTCKRLWGSI